MEANHKNSRQQKKSSRQKCSSSNLNAQNKSFLAWGPDEVKKWLQNEGFAEFWNFLRPHSPKGIDLLMLTPNDWQIIFRETKLDLSRPNVVQVNRLFYRINQLKLALGLPTKLPKLQFCLSGNAIFTKPSIAKQSSKDENSTDDDIEVEVRDDLLLKVPAGSEQDLSSTTENSHDVLQAGDGFTKESADTDLDEDDDVLEPDPHNLGPCPHCHHEIKREKSPILPERWKALLAFMYALGVSWVTAFVMVIVHDRVPDMEKYPPLPDILLDNIPHIPWAFEMCEFTGVILISLWCIVLVFHKHRFILMRRFFSISGTIFLLRCITMLITSLSVPGKHLDCSPRPYGDIWNKLYSAYIIWSGAGMTLQGVRTCGDYMFSGHTVTLTLLNFFITEYTSRKIYFLHTLTWICNVFGIFFILAAHEHYSIDVFVAFYITSRLFMYYHTLANQPLMNSKKSTPRLGHFSYDAHRVWLWFPMFSFFESRIDGKIPNEFEWPITGEDVELVLSRVSALAGNLREKTRHITEVKMTDGTENISSKKSDKNGFIKTKKQKKKMN